MAYHTVLYLIIFLPIVLLIYQLTPRSKRPYVLLAAGYLFFWLISGKLLLYLIGTTLVTHMAGRLLVHIKRSCRHALEQASETALALQQTSESALALQQTSESAHSLQQAPETAHSLQQASESVHSLQQASESALASIRARYKRKEKLALAAGIAVPLLTLIYLKYYNFFAESANQLLPAASFPHKNLLLPIGISFYTLQAIGYLADVYWEKVIPERHPGKLALFLAFFPQIMEGPISMYSETADALWEGAPIREENLSRGAIRIFWGLFKKMVIADRLYVLVNAIFDSYENYHGIVIAAAAVAYTVQLYMEFSGCMDIVIGSGAMFGVCLPENFRQPFAARSAAEFWQRWHITLGTWLKTYVFYPVSVSKPVKKYSRFAKQHLGKHLTKVGIYAFSLFPVWFLNGLWHGPQWNYLFYGMYYFVILLSEIALEPVSEKLIRLCRLTRDSAPVKLLQLLKTWTIIFTGELFFRANGLSAGIRMFASMFRDFAPYRLWNGTFLRFGLDAADYLAIGAGCLVVAIVGYVREQNLLGTEGLQKLRLPLRWALYYALIFAVIMFGAYGVGYQKVDLIYAGF